MSYNQYAGMNPHPTFTGGQPPEVASQTESKLRETLVFLQDQNEKVERVHAQIEQELARLNQESLMLMRSIGMIKDILDPPSVTGSIWVGETGANTR
jgi:hypothetical protein